MFLFSALFSDLSIADGYAYGRDRAELYSSADRAVKKHLSEHPSHIDRYVILLGCQSETISKILNNGISYLDFEKNDRDETWFDLQCIRLVPNKEIRTISFLTDFENGGIISISNEDKG